MANSWDPVRVKSLLRTTAQRLGQLQDRKDSHAQITSRDIATLLGQKSVALARNKAQNLLKDEAVSNAMELLEMYCGAILEGFSALEKDDLRLPPALIEAAGSITYAASFSEFQELMPVRDLLIFRLGPEFSKAALNNRDGYVPPRLLRTMHYTPSADEIDDFLLNTARKHGVEWKARMRPEEKISTLSEILDASDILGSVDLEKLRAVAASGFPPDPSWLRPRAWKILLGVTPTLKARWSSDAQGKRDSYYDLVRRCLKSVASASLPTSPLSASDRSLVSLIESLSRVPAHLFYGLEEEAEQYELCPVAECAAEDVRIDSAFALDTRLQLIQDGQSPSEEVAVSTPEIRLDAGSPPVSPTTTTAKENSDNFDLSSAAQGGPSSKTSKNKTLSLSSALAPRAFRSVQAHPSHVSALLRLLYIHKSLNPGGSGSDSPHIASLLAPLYVVANMEADPAELAHAEADAFWMFEALLQEVSELEESEGGLVWMGKLKERLAMADNELLEDLTLKGLDPALPQYSYRWLSPLLSQTLPSGSVYMVWDAILSQPEMSRSSNPKLEHLVDICAAMLVRARVRLLLLGNNGSKSPSLWDLPSSGVERPQLRPWELGNAFMEGMTLLQNYPINEAGGVEHILQVAGDIYLQRQQLSQLPRTYNTTLTSRIAETVWRGFTNQTTAEAASPEDSDEDEVLTELEETETETEGEGEQAEANGSAHTHTSSGSGWGSYLRSTVMRGITNQTAMESVSPNSLSPAASPQPSPRPSQDTFSTPPTSPPTSPPSSSRILSSHLRLPSSGSSLWGYAEKLRQSDVAASLSKASTNISAKAMDAWSARGASIAKESSTDGWKEAPVNEREKPESPALGAPSASVSNSMMSPRLRIDLMDTYSPPPRPIHFKAPRDTRLFSSEDLASAGIPGSPASPASTLTAETVSSGHSRAGSIVGEGFNSDSLSAVLPSWAKSIQPATPKPKSAPRPLLLGTSAASPSARISRSYNSTPVPDSTQWEDVMRNKASHSPRRDTQFTQSSVTSSSRHGRSLTSGSNKNGWESETLVSRIVPLNRQSSPMAPAFRLPRMSTSREPSLSSASEFGVLRSPKLPSDDSPTSSNGKARSESRPDSPSTLPSSPPPRTPVTSFGLSQQTNVRVNSHEKTHGSVVLSESSVAGIESAVSLKKPRKTPTLDTVGDTSDSSAPAPAQLNRSIPRIRTKRFAGRPAALRTRDIVASPSPDSVITSAISITSPSSFDKPNSSLAAPDFDSEAEPATTPRASNFPASTSPTLSIDVGGFSDSNGEGNGEAAATPQGLPRGPHSPRSPRRRKGSNESRSTRPRKNSGEVHSKRESQAHDGDDEGFDELLSSYESEASKDGHDVRP